MASITEQIKAFLNDGSGDGFGSGFSDGFGSGFCSGFGYGDGYGSGFGHGDGYGSGFGSGNGISDDYGDGFGSGDGLGDGFGDGSGIKSINNQDIYIVDGMPTIITALFVNCAKGFIVGSDFTLKPCYIAKSGDIIAHGKTFREAVAAIKEKNMAKFKGKDE